MSSEPRRWTIFIDESGDFDAPGAAVAIAGILLAETSETSADALRRGLERALPDIPWPPHAAHVNQTAWVAVILADQACNPPAPGAPPAALAAREAVAEFSRHSPVDLGQVQADLRLGRRPDFAAIKRLSKHLRDTLPVLARRIDGFALEAWAQVRAVAARLAADADASLLASGEAWAGAVGSGPDERYFGLLEATLSRAVHLLCRRRTPDRLGVRALERDVHEPAIDEPIPLLPRHLGEVARRLPSEGTSVVRVVPEHVCRYDRRVDIRFVLADFAANRARRVLGDARLPLVEAEHLLGDVGLPVRSGTPPRTHLAAAGALGQPAAPPRACQWAREQAEEWARGE